MAGYTREIQNARERELKEEGSWVPLWKALGLTDKEAEALKRRNKPVVLFKKQRGQA